MQTEQDHSVHKWSQYIKHKKKIVDDIARGDYGSSKKLEAITDDADAPKGIREFAESLGLMSVKLEAREYSLAEANENLKESLLHRKEFGRIFIVVVSFILSYLILTTMLGRGDMDFLGSRQLASYYFTLILLCLGSTLIFYAIQRSPEPAASFGLTLANKWNVVRMALLWTIPPILLSLLLKVYLIHTNPAFEGRPLIEIDLNIWYLVYIPGVFAQEFITRGGMQSSLVRLLTGRHAPAIAILITSFTFSALHFHHSTTFGMINFIAGLYWGWLFYRQQSLLGVTINHYIAGSFFFGFLGLEAWTMGLDG